MGLLQAGIGAVASALADQWREYFYCDALSPEVLVAKGRPRNGGGSDNIISDGSIVAVNEGQCMIIVVQGEVVEVCAQPGEFVFDMSTEPSIFVGDLGDSVMNTIERIGYRFSFGGSTANDQRVYFFNTKEIIGNKYGTPQPVPFRVVDANIGLDMDIAVRCNGEFSYRIIDPVLFYTNVCANISGEYRRSELDSQLKSEFLAALQPGFARISEMGVRYSAVPGHTMELAQALQDILSPSWAEKRGIALVSVGVNSITTSPEDEERIKELQRLAVMRDPNMRAANFSMAQGEALKAAAGNEAGAMVGFMGMNMAGAAAGNMAASVIYDGAGQPYQAQNAYNVAGSGQVATAAPAQAAGWTCANRHENPDGAKFCQECGSPKPAPAAGWTCPNGHENAAGAKFCPECGAPKPADGWTCANGHANPDGAKFCQECGSPRG